MQERKLKLCLPEKDAEQLTQVHVVGSLLKA